MMPENQSSSAPGIRKYAEEGSCFGTGMPGRTAGHPEDGCDLLGAGRRRRRRRNDHSLGIRAQGAERRNGVLSELGVELTGLRGLGDQAVVGVLDISGLDLERLVERLGADELFERRDTLLEQTSFVISRSRRRSPACGGGDAEGLDGRVEAIPAELLNGVELRCMLVLQRGGARASVHVLHRLEMFGCSHFCALHNESESICALHNHGSRCAPLYRVRTRCEARRHIRDAVGRDQAR